MVLYCLIVQGLPFRVVLSVSIGPAVHPAWHITHAAHDLGLPESDVPVSCHQSPSSDPP